MPPRGAERRLGPFSHFPDVLTRREAYQASTRRPGVTLRPPLRTPSVRHRAPSRCRSLASVNQNIVTGVSGFVGSHVAHRLLEDGFDVTGTVRSGKVDPVTRAYSCYGARFRLAVVEDLVTSDLTAAFQSASSLRCILCRRILTPRTNIDVHAVIHVGTPLSGPPETVLDGAVRGTKNVLQHAARAGVARIVVTGSVASMAKYEDFWADRLITEQGTSESAPAHWNPETYADAFRADKGFFTTYSVAKMLAERELHAFAAQHPRIAITSILPPFIYGPFGPGQSTDLDSFWRLSSNGFLYALISGPPGRAVSSQYPVYPAFVHVGDLARAHVAALHSATDTAAAWCSASSCPAARSRGQTPCDTSRECVPRSGRVCRGYRKLIWKRKRKKAHVRA
ncbi:hypothetical protein EVG20_g8408 [Dentipellis fragilis]|uniref:C2H2-type domain-containing protein n=1 Tax=Dentipellis fragilis TaxID=205917 RepID=A0A4Y9Y7A1_9AGAM|nr:hypothetical protein EVG20_g8408 [Dentipellis fragilis]